MPNEPIQSQKYYDMLTGKAPVNHPDRRTGVFQDVYQRINARRMDYREFADFAATFETFVREQFYLELVEYQKNAANQLANEETTSDPSVDQEPQSRQSDVSPTA